MKSFEDMQKFGKDNTEVAMKTLAAFPKSVQTIAVEMADYSKKAFEDGAAATEKLIGAKSIEKAVEVQSDYFKTAYEGLVSQTAKLGELTGVSLMLGIFVRLFGIIGALQILNLWLGLYSAPGEWPWTYFFLLVLMLTLTKLTITAAASASTQS